MATFSSFLVFPHLLLITIDRIILTFFLNFLFTLSLFPPFLLFCFNFILLLLSPAFSIRRSWSYFTNFFISFFKFFLISVVSIQFSSSISLTSFKFIIGCSSFSWISTAFSPFSSFFISFSSSLFSSSSYTNYTMWLFPPYSFIFPSFTLVSAFHSSSIFPFISDPAIAFPILQFSSVFFLTFFLIQFQPSFPHSLA